MAVVGHLNRPTSDVVHLAFFEAVESEALGEIVKRRSLHLYISVLTMKQSILILTHLNHSVIIALVSTGAVVKGDCGATVSRIKDSRPRLVILTRIILLEVEVNVLKNKFLNKTLYSCNYCLYLVSPSQSAHLILGGAISLIQIKDSRVRARLQRCAQERIIMILGLLS